MTFCRSSGTNFGAPADVLILYASRCSVWPGAVGSSPFLSTGLQIATGFFTSTVSGPMRSSIVTPLRGANFVAPLVSAGL